MILKTILNNIDRFFISYLEEKFSAKDYRLLKGAYCSEDLFNDELDILKPDKDDSYESEISNSQYVETSPQVETTL